jgi:hypothetical protein
VVAFSRQRLSFLCCSLLFAGALVNLQYSPFTIVWLPVDACHSRAICTCVVTCHHPSFCQRARLYTRPVPSRSVLLHVVFGNKCGDSVQISEWYGRCLDSACAWRHTIGWTAVSGIFVQLGQGKSCLLDCGEGSWHQLCRVFGVDDSASSCVTGLPFQSAHQVGGIGVLCCT